MIKHSLIDKYTIEIVIDDKIISRGSVIINPHNEDNPVGFIEDVFTSEEYRKCGYATNIISRLIKVCEEYRCYKIMLYCSNENTRLYEKLGFVKNQNIMRLNLHG